MKLFTKKITEGFDSLYLKSSNKRTSAVNVDSQRWNTEKEHKHIIFENNNLDRSTPNCDIFAETPAIKENSSSKLNSDISKNVPKFPDSSTLPDTREADNSVQFMKCHMLHIKDKPFVAMIMSERCLILFIKAT